MPEAYIFSRRKQPDSRVFFVVDFRSEDPTENTPRLEADENLSGANISVDDPGLVIGSGAYSPLFLPGGKSIRVWVEGGVTGSRYHVTVDVDTSGSDSKNFPSRSMARTFEVVVV